MPDTFVDAAVGSGANAPEVAIAVPAIVFCLSLRVIVPGVVMTVDMSKYTVHLNDLPTCQAPGPDAGMVGIFAVVTNPASVVLLEITAVVAKSENRSSCQPLFDA